MEHIKSDFISKGIRCDGDLLLPEGVSNPPVIIMAHGLAAQKDFGLMAYAEQFVKNNMAVYLFDYRSFGASDGQPRQVVDPFLHLEDWAGAVSHIRNIENINSDKIALWGSSFSGGHVLAVAAMDKGISAVVSQVPHVSSFASMTIRKLSDLFLSGIYGGYDLIREILGMSPHYSPVIGRVGSFAAMNTAESYDGFMSIVEKDSIWENKMASRGFLKILLYSPIKYAKKIKAPVMLIAAKDDSLIPFSASKKCAKQISDCELIALDCNHFAPYTGEVFLSHIKRQTDFLKKKLSVL